MENKKIDNKLNELLKVSSELNSLVRSEVTKYEELLSDKVIEPFERLLINNLGFKVSTEKDRGLVKFIINGFNSSNEARDNMKGISRLFKKDTYDSYLTYSVNVKNYKDFDMKKLEEVILEYINDLYEKSLEVHKRNVEINNNNTSIYNGVTDLLNRLGFKSSYLGYRTGRHKKKEWLDYSFKGELRSQVPMGWTEGTLASTVTNLKNSLKTNIEMMDKLLKEGYKEFMSSKENELLANPQYIYDVMSIVNKLNEIDEYGFSDLLKEVPSLDKLKKCILVSKGLQIVYNIAKARYFMNHSLDYANEALSILQGLKIHYSVKDENKVLLEEIEADIKEGINKFIEDGSNDGRIFRDIKYNYNNLQDVVHLGGGNYYLKFIEHVIKLVELEYKYLK